jgi:hypothetical protein
VFAPLPPPALGVVKLFNSSKPASCLFNFLALPLASSKSSATPPVTSFTPSQFKSGIVKPNRLAIAFATLPSTFTTAIATGIILFSNGIKMLPISLPSSVNC